MGPLIPFGVIPANWDFLIAMLIGIAFGFVLESSGFSSSRNIAGVFYGYDFVVLRVFFTAAIVAMIGIQYFGYLGWIDMDYIYVLPTYVWPMIIGSIFMGIGFVMSGFCPGTSFTALAIGKLDAIVFIVGIYVGILLFSELFPFIESFYYSNNLGNVQISEILGISNELFTFIFTIIAVIAFYATFFIEKRVRKTTSDYKFD